MPFSLRVTLTGGFTRLLWIFEVSFFTLYKNRSLYHVPEENSALSSAARLTVTESRCPRCQRYLHFGIGISVCTNMYEDLKKGLGARTRIFCHCCLLFSNYIMLIYSHKVLLQVLETPTCFKCLQLSQAVPLKLSKTPCVTDKGSNA